MTEEIQLEKCNFQNLRNPLDLELGLGHTAYRRASLIDLYLHTNFHWNLKNFLRTDVWTDGHTYGWTFPPSNVIRSTRRSRPKKWDGICLYNSPWHNTDQELTFVINTCTFYAYIHFLSATKYIMQVTCARIFSIKATAVSDFPVPGGPCSRHIFELA